MHPGAQAKKSPWPWVFVALGASCFLCTAGGMALAALGFLVGDEEASAPAGAASPSASQPGAPGGYALRVPSSFQPNGDNRWLFKESDGAATRSVELIRLPALPGLERAPERLVQEWNARVAVDWEGASPTPFVMRRLVGNGARAHYTGAALHARGGGPLTYVSLYLVEAHDRLEPLVFLQQYADPTGFQSTADMMASLSWPHTHRAIEDVIAGVQGSPVGLPLVERAAVAGNWVSGTNQTAQWVNTVTGGTSMTAVAYSVELTFSADGRYAYRYQGASGQVGALQFGTEQGQGAWRLERDELVLQADGGKVKKYLVVSAARGPDGKRTLLLMSQGHSQVAPFAMAAGELFRESP
jgi:hypothetical protein